MDEAAPIMRTGATYSFTATATLETRRDGDGLEVWQEGLPVARFPVACDQAGATLLDATGQDGGEPARKALVAALEALFVSEPSLARVQLQLEAGSGLERACRETALALADGGVLAELFWQRREAWLAAAGREVFPQMQVMGNGRRHPLRPAQPRGVVYARYIPWLGQVITFRAVSVEDDLERFHRWMNDPRVEQIWSEAGDLATHRAYLERLLADPHMLPLIGCFDGQPFGYFELYWAKENRLGPYYDAHDYDRGWHVLVGEDTFRGKAWVSAWLPSLMHYMFLDDPRTQRIVGEPAASHAQQIRNLDRSGFAKVKHVDFPHKRALLVQLLRERFFADRLWAPGRAGA